ncbi:extracellular solute-binding protein family 5 [Ignisphaera aggregans DSM 17230]|uniref:Extracellular solute-binding protein family 5 n=1 Tax=Ignisphaera aggregans (strain DSM 17230 / JCM 13409 / AQ1.S1) TaxID=583356 RepID=E0SSU6_IGNAA|nr:extracellular solute-binding protein family 5 [Ignisphaera aggregans DSM 17230]
MAEVRTLAIYIVLLVIVAIAAYYVGTLQAPTKTVTTTITERYTATLTTTVTETITATETKPVAISPTPTPTPGYITEKIVIGTTDKVTDLDPSNAYDFFTWEILNNVMEGLVKYEPGTDRIIPGIAERWESRDNGTIWIFYLRKNVRFADGTPLTAADVVRSIKRVMKINGDPAWLVTEFIEDVKALDNYTVEFILKKPTGYFLALVATPPYFPVHPSYPDDKIVSDAIWGGAGPYMIREFKRDQYIVLEANPYYYGEQPKTKTIIVRFYKDAASLRLALEKGEVDIAWRTLRPTDYEDLKKNPNFKVIEVPGSFIRYLVINVKMDPVSNVLVRRAIAAAIDRKDLAETVFLETMEPLYSLVPKGMWSHEDVFLEKYGDGNLTLAIQLLKQAGYSENNKLHIELWYTPTHYGDTEADLAQLIKEQLERTGLIVVDLKSSEWATYVDQLRNGQMMIALLGWYPDYIDPDNFLYPFLHSQANKWTGTGYANPEVDRLIEEGAIELDQTKRAEIYGEVQRILAEDVPYIPLLQGKLLMVTQKNIEGVKLGPTLLFYYWTVYKTTG